MFWDGWKPPNQVHICLPMVISRDGDVRFFFATPQNGGFGVNSPKIFLSLSIYIYLRILLNWESMYEFFTLNLKFVSFLHNLDPNCPGVCHDLQAHDQKACSLVSGFVVGLVPATAGRFSWRCFDTNENFMLFLEQENGKFRKCRKVARFMGMSLKSRRIIICLNGKVLVLKRFWFMMDSGAHDPKDVFMDVGDMIKNQYTVSIIIVGDPLSQSLSQVSQSVPFCASQS